MRRRWPLLLVVCAIAAGGFGLGAGTAPRHASAPPPAPRLTVVPSPAIPQPRVAVRQPGGPNPCAGLVPRAPHAILPVPQWTSPCAQALAQELPAGAR